VRIGFRLDDRIQKKESDIQQTLLTLRPTPEEKWTGKPKQRLRQTAQIKYKTSYTSYDTMIAILVF
jgi:hypothetical protein